jgi:hypothetical protein
VRRPGITIIPTLATATHEEGGRRRNTQAQPLPAQDGKP